jgi:predicted MFS family arabinose efflux permease
LPSDASAGPTRDRALDVEASVPTAAFLWLSIAAFGSASSLRVTDALLPRLAVQFRIPLGEASLVITLFAIAYGVSQLFFGPVGDRFGKYVVIAWACVACSITAAACGIAFTFPLLVVARLLAGATAAAIIPLSMAWIGDVVAYDKRQPILARFLIGQILGVSTGVLIGGLAADHFNWRIAFFVLAAIFVAVAAALFRLDRRLPPRARMTRVRQSGALRHTVMEFREVLRQPWARIVLTTVFLEGAFLFGAFAFIASHLHREDGVSLSVAGSVVMLFGLGGLAFAAFIGWLVRRLGEVGLTRWGGVLLGASLLAIGFAPIWWFAIPACLCAGLGFYMLHNTLQTNATQMAPERRGAAVSAFASCLYLGQSVGVATAGALVERVGTGSVIRLGGAGLIVVAIVFSTLRARHVATSA